MSASRSGNRRRVAFVIGFLNSGGAERAALNMAAAAPRSECVVIAERRGGDLSDDPHAQDVVFASERAMSRSRATRIVTLARTLRRTKPDVVVSMLSPLVTLTASRAIAAPVIHWQQAPWSRTTAAASDGMVGQAQRTLLREAAVRSAMIAAATPGLCEECVSFGIPREKIALLPNGLALDQSPPNATVLEDSSPTIVTVGRLEPPKRHDLTIRAVARIAKDRPVRLLVVGSGSHESALRELAADLGIGGHVEFTGFVDAPQEQLRRGQVFTLATEYEGFGNVIVEALAAGLSVVVSDVPYGPRFILADGKYGELVPPGSVDALEQALRRAIDRAPLDRATARRAQERAAMFDISRAAARFETLIEIADGRGTSIPAELRCWE